MGTIVAERGAQRDGAPIKTRDGAAIDLLQQIVNVGRNHVDERRRRFDRFLFGEGFALQHCLLCELRVATALAGQRARVGGDVFGGLFRRGLVHRLAASGDRMRRADVGAGRHCRKIGRNGQQESGRCRARARRCDMDGNRSFRRKHSRDDLPRRVDEPARRAQRKDDERGTGCIGALHRLDHVFGGDRMNDAVDLGGIDNRRLRGRLRLREPWNPEARTRNQEQGTGTENRLYAMARHGLSLRKQLFGFGRRGIEDQRALQGRAGARLILVLKIGVRQRDLTGCRFVAPERNLEGINGRSRLAGPKIDAPQQQVRLRFVRREIQAHDAIQ